MKNCAFLQWLPLFLIGLTGVLALNDNSLAGTTENRISEQLQEVLLPKPIVLSDFDLIDHRNMPFTKNSLENKWTFLFFGYTHCPDICPNTLSELETVASQLKPQPPTQNNIQVVFVSVDPKRDTPTELAKYIDYFDSSFLGVTGQEKELRKLTRQLGVSYSLEKGSSTEYFVNHSSILLLFDTQGRYYARFFAPHYAEDILSTFNLLQQNFKNTP